ncbi:MAG: APC family permease, partial [Dehalococcoidia bacterium]|nr:APC family permease [Dehalococcoidia bacterium]
NLRGIRESGNIFSIPTFLFIVSILGLIGYGVSAIALGAPIEAPPSRAVGDEHGAIQPLTVFLILSAFAQGCTAMTGVEAVANGVPALKPPESRNARIVLIWMASLLGMMFLGISFLAVQLGVTPDPAEQETVVSQIARLLLGVGPGYFVIQFATAFILVLAANTAFADFPRLASILARDKVLPNQFAFRGDRLAFNVGVIVLTVLASLLVFVFNGSVQALIPLYAVGVFTSFTLSQSGMVAHWFRLKEGNWRLSATINLIGAVTTGVVAVIIGVTKFERGAWLVLVLIPLLVVVFSSIRRHYLMVARELQPRPEGARRPGPARAIVPIAALNYPAQQAIALAQTLAAHVTAVHVTDNVAAGEQMRASWQRSYPGVPLVIIESPYRQLLAPLLAYIDAVREQHPAETVLVVLPEFVTAHWWENALHNQTALRIRAALQYRPGVVTVSVPYHLPSRDPAEGGGVGSGVGTLAHGGSEPTPAERVATSP